MTLSRCSENLYDLEGAIRVLLLKRGKTDVSSEACKEYARHFIASRVKGWKPGKKLKPKDAQLVGCAFLRVIGWRIRKVDEYPGPRRRRDD